MASSWAAMELDSRVAPSPFTSSLLSLYASLSASLMLLRNAYHELVPKRLESYLVSKLSPFFSASRPSEVTLIIDDSWGGFRRNRLIRAATVYISTKIGPSNRTIRIGKFRKLRRVIASLVEGEHVVDVFDGVEIRWKIVSSEEGNTKSKGGRGSEECHFEVSFEEKYREKVVGEYFNHVLNSFEALKKGEKVLKLYHLDEDNDFWESIELKHPATFETLAMDSNLKKSIIEDLDRFLGGKDFYRRVGRGWKRCYLIYGPPGTGKSSLVAAMANYLHYHVYELVLSSIFSEFDLRRSLLGIGNKCIIVVEDIDCISDELGPPSEFFNKESDDSSKDEEDDYYVQLSPCDVLNCIDGLWSNCEEERIIVFTTNHIEALEPELLVQGRVDMQIHMPYCSVEGFRGLARNYLGIEEEVHPLFEEIDELIQTTEVTSASLAEELLKSDDPDIALGEVVNFLRRKNLEKIKLEQQTDRPT